MELRKTIFDRVKAQCALEGSNDVEFAGKTLSVKTSLTRSLDVAALSVLRLSDHAWDERSTTLVRTKQELDLTMYRKLPDELRHVFDGVLTIKPSTPSISIKEEK